MFFGRKIRIITMFSNRIIEYILYIHICFRSISRFQRSHFTQLCPVMYLYILMGNMRAFSRYQQNSNRKRLVHRAKIHRYMKTKMKTVNHTEMPLYYVYWTACRRFTLFCVIYTLLYAFVLLSPLSSSHYTLAQNQLELMLCCSILKVY